ncbi:MAG: hypothetical protein AB8F94_15470 [Saprospiraceae bacterium]
MNNFLKYFIIFCLFALGAFIIYVQMKEIESEKPTVYIDNYSGSSVKVFRKKEVWIDLKNESSLVKKDLKPGTHVLHIHKMENNSIDTIRINIKKERNYILNLFGKMIYYEGELNYQSRPDYKNISPSEEREITKSFFQTSADFILEEPPSLIEVTSTFKTPKNFNSKTKRKYLRRKNQVW